MFIFNTNLNAEEENEKEASPTPSDQEPEVIERLPLEEFEEEETNGTVNQINSPKPEAKEAITMEKKDLSGQKEEASTMEKKDLSGQKEEAITMEKKDLSGQKKELMEDETLAKKRAEKELWNKSAEMNKVSLIILKTTEISPKQMDTFLGEKGGRKKEKRNCKEKKGGKQQKAGQELRMSNGKNSKTATVQ